MEHMSNVSEVYVENIGCSTCGSSDSLGVYQREDGSFHGTCFSNGCHTNNPYEEEIVNTEKKEESMHDINKSNINELQTRGISKEACERYGVSSIVKDGFDNIHFYPHTKQGKASAHMIREVTDKKFTWSGSDKKQLEFFGQNVCGDGGKMIMVTEGQCDTLAAYDLLKRMNKNYRVCSIVNGASSAVKCFKDNYEWVNKFENIFLSFDQDEPGMEAAIEVAALFPPNKVKILKLSEKDANDMLVEDKQQEFLSAIYSAKEAKPDGIVSVEDIFDEAIAPPILGKSFPWETLTDVTYGYRTKEIYGVGAGCFDKNTEYLTEKGWKSFNAYTGGKVAQEVNGVLEFVTPSKYIDVEAKEMYEYSSERGLSMVLSDNHRVVLHTKKGEEILPLKDVRMRHKLLKRGLSAKIPSGFKWDGGNSLNYSDSYLRLKVAVFADGSFRKDNKSTRCNVHLLKERKKKRLVELLSQCGLEYGTRDAPDGSSEFYFYMDNKDKSYPVSWYSLSKNQIEIIGEECLLWDGDQKRSFCSNIKEDCDFIQFVFSCLGKRASLNFYKSKVHLHWNTTYRVCVSDNTYYGLERPSNPSSGSTEFEPFTPSDGRMYCFTVPSGKLIVRRRDRIFISGNSGCGKTEAFKEMINHTIYYHKEPAGVIFLEEPAHKTLKVLAGKKVNKRFHIPSDKGGDWTIDELKDGINDLKGRVYLYNHFGSKDWESIRSKIRYMVVVLGIKDIYLDHLTALIAQEDNEYKALNRIMEDMASLVQELDCTIFYISHLRKASGTPHEEGGHVSADQFKGSGAIVYWSNFLFGIERNQQAEDVEERNTSTFIVLKDRNTGLATGVRFKLKYDHDTGRWGESEDELFEDEEF